MVEIKINGKLVDMFPDTKVSGNYTPVDFSGNEGFEVPYTDTFSLPMTERNASILGFNKNTSSFDNVERKGKVYADGELMFSGIVEIDEAVYETLEETITIRIIDIISYIFNDAKDKSISCIMDYKSFNGRSFIAVKNLGLYPYSDNSPVGIAFVDQTGFAQGLTNGNLSGLPVYAYKGRDKGSLPFCFKADEVLSAIFEQYGLKVDKNKLPYDLINHNVAVSFPLTYMSNAKRNTTMTITNGVCVGYSYMPKSVDDSTKDRFTDYPYLSMLIPTSRNVVENNTPIFINRKFNAIRPSGVSVETNRSVSIVDTEFMLKPTSVRLTVGTGKTLFSVGDGDNINSYNVERISCRDFFIYAYQIDEIGNRIAAYRIGEVKIAEDLRTVESISVSDDYLFSEKLNIEAGQKIILYQALIPKQPCDIFRVSTDDNPSARYEVDSLIPNNTFNQTSATYSVRLNATITANYEVLYGDEHVKHSDYQICSSFLTPNQLTDGTTYCGSTPNSFNNSPISLMNVRESLEATDITISEFLSDFCNRFNCKITSDGVYVYITQIDGDSEDIIDISTRVDSSLIASISDKDANVRSMQVVNTAYNCFMDKYFDGRAFGSSEPRILDKTKSDEKTVTIKSAIIPNVMSGKKRKSQSENVTELYEYFRDFSYLGYTEYEDFTNSESGIRYCYVDTSKKKKIRPLYPTLTYDGNGNSFGSGVVDFIYQPSNAVVAETSVPQEVADSVGIRKGSFTLYKYTTGVPSEVVGTLSYIIKDGAMAFTANINGNYSDVFYRNGVTTLDYSYIDGIGAAMDTGVAFSYSSNSGFSINDNIEFNIINGQFRITSKTGVSFNGFSFVIKTFYNGQSNADANKVRAVPFATGYDVLTNMGTAVPPIEYASEISNTAKNSDGTLDTLSYNKLGINKQGVSDDNIKTAYDRYYSDYETSILSGKSTTIELDVYLTSNESKRVMSGCRMKLYGQIYTVMSVSEMDFSNSYGGVVKIKLAKLK